VRVRPWAFRSQAKLLRYPVLSVRSLLRKRQQTSKKRDLILEVPYQLHKLQQDSRAECRRRKSARKESTRMKQLYIQSSKRSLPRHDRRPRQNGRGIAQARAGACACRTSGDKLCCARQRVSPVFGEFAGGRSVSV